MNGMNLMSGLDCIAFFASFLLSIGSICYFKLFSKKDKNQVVEYMVMGRQLTLPMFIGTLVATWYGGILGVTQISYDHGIYNFITQGVFWYISAALFAVFMVKRIRKSNSLTFSEFILNIYGHKSARLTALMLLIKCLPITYAVSFGLFLKVMFGFELNNAILISTVIVGLYCLLGGMRAIVISDFIQFIFMYLSIILVVIFSFKAFGGVEYLKFNLPESHFTIQGNHDGYIVLSWFFIALNTTFLSPVFYQRCFAAKNDKIAKKGILISIFFWFTSDIITTLSGLYARAYFPINPGEFGAPDAFLKYAFYILPDGVRGVFAAGILMTVFSALDSFMFAASSAISYDLVNAKLRENQNVRKAAVIFTCFLTVLTTNYFDGRFEKIWLTIETFFMAVLFVPLICGVFMRKLMSEKLFCFNVVAGFTVLLGLNYFYSLTVFQILMIGVLINIFLIFIKKSYDLFVLRFE
jgi:SSS family solute:Na+ symporter